MEPFTFSGYQLQFQILPSNENQNSSTLRITAEHRKSFEKYTGEYTTQDTLRLTDNICKTAEVLSYRLLDAFHKNTQKDDRKVSVKLIPENQQSNIVYEEIAIFYGHETKTNFVVSLTRVEVNEIELLKRRISELELQISESIGTKGDYVWNANSAQANSFQISQGGKKARKVVTGWTGMRTDKPFPPNGKHRFSIQLNAVPRTDMMLGVSTGDTALTAGAYATATGWMYYLTNRTRQRSGANIGSMPEIVPIPRVNDIITVVVDVDHLMIGYEVNGFATGVAFVLPEPTDRKSLYPTIDVHTEGIEVTIV